MGGFALTAYDGDIFKLLNSQSSTRQNTALLPAIYLLTCLERPNFKMPNKIWRKSTLDLAQIRPEQRGLANTTKVAEN